MLFLLLGSARPRPESVGDLAQRVHFFSTDGERNFSAPRVRAFITEPAPNHEARRGELAIRGVAWSGAAPIARVEVNVGGRSWQEARLVSERKRHSWEWWELVTHVE